MQFTALARAENTTHKKVEPLGQAPQAPARRSVGLAAAPVLLGRAGEREVDWAGGRGGGFAVLDGALLGRGAG